MKKTTIYALAGLMGFAVLFAALLSGCSGGGGSGKAAGAPPTGVAPGGTQPGGTTPPPGGGTPPGGGQPGANAAPSFSSSAPIAAVEGQAYSYQPSASDPDGDPLSFRKAAGPNAMTVDPQTGAVAWTPVVGDAGDHAVSLEVSDGQLTGAQSFTLTVSAAGAPPPPPPPPPTGLPTNPVLTDLGLPPGGLPVISDLVSFDTRLFLLEAQNPLSSFGASVFTYDEPSGFVRVLNDPTSQGYLRGRVIQNELYVPDGDPNGLDPSFVYRFSSATSAPVRETVTGSVHNFDVIEFNGEIFTSGGLANGQSGLNRRNAQTGVWDVVSQGGFSRLKYLGVLDGFIWAGKRTVGSAADMVRIDASMQQGGIDVLQNAEANVVCIETLGPNLYVTMGGPNGVAHFRIEPGLALTQLNGITGAIAFDFVEHTDGNTYAVASDIQATSFVFGSTDGINFQQLLSIPDLRFGAVGNNADGRPSIASFAGKIHLGSSTNGRLYRLD